MLTAIAEMNFERGQATIDAMADGDFDAAKAFIADVEAVSAIVTAHMRKLIAQRGYDWNTVDEMVNGLSTALYTLAGTFDVDQVLEENDPVRLAAWEAEQAAIRAELAGRGE